MKFHRVSEHTSIQGTRRNYTQHHPAGSRTLLKRLSAISYQLRQTTTTNHEEHEEHEDHKGKTEVTTDGKNNDNSKDGVVDPFVVPSLSLLQFFLCDLRVLCVLRDWSFNL